MQQLASMLAKLNVQSPSRSTAPRRRKPRARKERTAVSVDGEIHMKRHELVSTLKANNAKLSDNIVIKPASFNFLTGIAPSFERSRWLKLHFYYKPAVAVTTGGLVAMGVDWDGTTAVSDREKVLAFTPSQSIPVWQDSQAKPLVLPASRLQSRTWYAHNSSTALESSVGTLRIAGTTTAETNSVVGEVWVYYEMVMQGTNPK